MRGAEADGRGAERPPVVQVGLFLGHAYLDARLQVKGMLILDPETFRPAHRLYLWTHTVQWGAGLVFVWLMLRAWAGEDRTSVQSSGRMEERP